MAHDLLTPFPPVINGVVIPHVSSVEPNQQLKEIELMSLGKLEQIDLAVAYEEPQVSFETASLDVLFATTGAGGLGMSLNDGVYCNADNTVIQYQRAAAEGGIDADDVHVTLTSLLAWLGVESIKASQDETQPAMAKLMTHLLQADDGTLPNAIAVDAALTGSVSLTNRWALGPVYINGSLVDGLQTAEYVSNLAAKPKRANGQTVANRIRITKRRHEMRLGFENLALANTYGFGMSNAAGAVSMYLRHISSAGGRTAVGTTSHVKIRFSAAKLIMQEIKGGGADAEVQVTPTIVNTGTVTISVASAIP